MPALAIVAVGAYFGAAWATVGAVFFAILSDIMFVSSYLNYQRLKGKQRDFSIAGKVFKRCLKGVKSFNLTK